AVGRKPRRRTDRKTLREAARRGRVRRRIVDEADRAGERWILARQVGLRNGFALIEDAVRGAGHGFRIDLPGQPHAGSEIVFVGRRSGALGKVLGVYREYIAARRQEIRLAVILLHPGKRKDLITHSPIQSQRGSELPTVFDEQGRLRSPEAARSTEQRDVAVGRQAKYRVGGTKSCARGRGRILGKRAGDAVYAVGAGALQQIITAAQDLAPELEGVRAVVPAQ